jgi:hypothetical protein
MSFGCVCVCVWVILSWELTRAQKSYAWPLYSDQYTSTRNDDDASFDVIHHYCFGALVLKGGVAACWPNFCSLCHIGTMSVDVYTRRGLHRARYVDLRETTTDERSKSLTVESKNPEIHISCRSRNETREKKITKNQRRNRSPGNTQIQNTI